MAVDAWTPPACPEHDRACDPLLCPVLWPPVVIPDLVARRDRKRFEATRLRNEDRSRRSLWPGLSEPMPLEDGPRPGLRVVGGRG